jgi:glucokinase
MQAIGIDIGGTSFKFGLVNDKGQLSAADSYPVDYSKSQEYLIEELGRKINEFLEKNKLSKEQIKGIGIGCPGSISTTTGCCDYSNNLHWSHLNVCRIITGITGIESKISNDANVACLGETKFGAGKNHANSVMLTLGTGVGSGIVINGRLFEGNDGKGAELGHEVIKVGGRKCTCGRRGCLEAYASATALIRDTKSAMEKDKKSLMWEEAKGSLKNVDGTTAFQSSKKGDISANKVIDKYVFYLSQGMLNICSVFRPDCIILGGGISNQKDYLIKKIVSLLEKDHYGFGIGPKVEVLTAQLGNKAGIIGAASLFFD